MDLRGKEKKENKQKGKVANVQKKVEERKYKPELSKVGHLDFSHASQNLHHVKAFVCLEPTGDEKKVGLRRFNINKKTIQVQESTVGPGGASAVLEDHSPTGLQPR